MDVTNTCVSWSLQQPYKIQRVELFYYYDFDSRHSFVLLYYFHVDIMYLEHHWNNNMDSVIIAFHITKKISSDSNFFISICFSIVYFENIQNQYIKKIVYKYNFSNTHMYIYLFKNKYSKIKWKGSHLMCLKFYYNYKLANVRPSVMAFMMAIVSRRYICKWNHIHWSIHHLRFVLCKLWLVHLFM